MMFSVPKNTIELEAVIDAVVQAGDRMALLPAKWATLAETVMHYRPHGVRAVVLGGGTGMSTIVGGDAAHVMVRGRRFVGLKAEFDHLDVVACVTDDGGSTGELLKYLPIIGIGDLRKSCVALMAPERLRKRYGIALHDAVRIMGHIQRVFHWRFPSASNAGRVLRDPFLLISEPQRAMIPARLRAEFRRWGGAFDEMARARGIPLAGHCLGNLLLVGALRCAGWRRTERPPSAALLQKGLDLAATAVGAPAGVLHAATHVPGQLCFRYANGVEVIGQSKAGRARRGFPIDFVYGLYAGEPAVPRAVLRALRSADVIVYAPGSLYSSMIPILQLPEIAGAIRANHKALKVLAANFWIQEGETDISPRQRSRGFFVSDLVKAYEQNIPGGARGLFDTILCSNLEHLPGNVLRNYALEGKHPIHLDRREVEALGYHPVEATLFSAHRDLRPGFIHHDPEKFALALRTLVFIARDGKARARLFGGRGRANPAFKAPSARRALPRATGFLPCERREHMNRILRCVTFTHAKVRECLSGLLWTHRDIAPEHLGMAERVTVVKSARWGRSVEWDNVLAYYEPRDAAIYLHESLLHNEARMGRDLLIALGESLLGDYIERREWTPADGAGRCYTIELRDAARRRSCLTDSALREYLRMARMTPDPNNRRVFRIVLNDDEGFLPPGLLFGLLYAWYLDNASGGVMEYEMSLLQWPETELIPYQAAERRRKAALIEFFRRVVFHRT
jgi:uncharacterized cofD-like protein